MRPIIAGLFISLDGVVESPEAWNLPYYNEEMTQAVGSQIVASSRHTLGTGEEPHLPGGPGRCSVVRGVPARQSQRCGAPE
jgi:hypothetical protein